MFIYDHTLGVKQFFLVYKIVTITVSFLWPRYSIPPDHPSYPSYLLLILASAQIHLLQNYFNPQTMGFLSLSILIHPFSAIRKWQYYNDGRLFSSVHLITSVEFPFFSKFHSFTILFLKFVYRSFFRPPKRMSEYLQRFIYHFLCIVPQVFLF